MNIKLPQWNGKKWRFKKIKKLKIKKRTKPRKQKRAKPVTPFQQGVKDIQSVTTSWSSQPNPPKVYIGPYRIHHGLVSAIMALAGYYYDDDYLKGAGLAGALDDIDDLPDWLNFRDNSRDAL